MRSSILHLAEITFAVVVKKDKLVEEKLRDKMKRKTIISGRIIITLLILLSMAFNLKAQDDVEKQSPPGSQAQSRQQEKSMNADRLHRQDESGNPDLGSIQDNKKKKEGDNSKQVKEVRSTKPDMNKSKGARPPYINRPSGTVRPQGAGKPGGAIRPGRR